MEYHRLDAYPIPKAKAPLFINEPWLIDISKLQLTSRNRLPELQEDNIRVYVPLDLNKAAILRRLEKLILQYGRVDESNESNIRMDVEQLISQVEIYDQVILKNQGKETEEHSEEAVELIEQFIQCLEMISAEQAMLFPVETIDYLKEEYLLQR